MFSHTSVADPNHVDADPDPAYHFDADVEPNPAFNFGVDPEPDHIFHFTADADPDPDPRFQIKTQNLEKVLK
jgi:hypothetical protein